MMRFLLRSLLFSLVGTLAYLAVFYVTFPADDLKARIMTEARKNNFDLRIGDVAPHGITGLGLSFDGVSVAMMDPPKRPRRKRGKSADDETDTPSPEAEQAPEKAPFLNLDAVDIGVAMLPLLRPAEDRVADLDIDASLYGGDVTGTLSLGPTNNVVDMTGSAIELARYPIVGEDFKIDALGLIAFNVDLDLSKEDYKASKGAVSMDIQGLRILKSSTVSLMPLPVELLFTESLARLNVADGKADVEALRLMGEAISVEGDGEIFLNSNLSRSRLKMKIRIKLGEDLQILSAVLSSRAKSDDGYYHYMLTGLITNPRFRPDASAARRWNQEHGSSPSASRGRPSRGIDLTDDELDEDDEDNVAPSRARPSTRRRAAKPAKGIPVDKSSVARPGISDEERERRREERRRLAEERRERREERLQKIREAQERTGVSWEDRGKQILPPFPGDGEAPFRPGIGRGDIPPPAGVDDDGGEEFIEDEEFEPEEEFQEDFQEPDVEILPEDDFDAPPPPDERFDDEEQQEGDFDEPMDDDGQLMD